MVYMFVSPQILMLNPRPPCDGISRWSLWEEIKVESKTVMNGINALMKVAPERSIAPSTM